MSDLSYKRVLIKLSGERMSAGGNGILDTSEIEKLVDEVIAVHDEGMQVGVVLGGGNILRGHEAAAAGIEEAQAHYMGSLATVINSLAFQSVMEQRGKYTRVLSAIPMDTVAEPYIRRRALAHMRKGRIVIFAGGTGNPFFTTDSAGALRAIETDCDILVKATKVDGIYDSDPKKNPDAKHLDKLTYKEILVDNLQVMDGAAIALCREHGMPLMVCNVEGNGSLLKALRGEVRRTLVSA